MKFEIFFYSFKNLIDKVLFLMKIIYVMILIVIELILIDIKSIVYGIYVWKLDIDLMFMYIG